MDAVLTRPLLPLALPLLGAGVIWVLPSGLRFAQLRRCVYVLTLLATCAVLLVAPGHGLCQVDLPFVWLDPACDYALHLGLDGVGVGFASLLVGALALGAISVPKHPMGRFQTGALLITVLGAIWTVSAASLLTLCLGWTLTEGALLSVELIRAPDEHIPHALRRVLSNLLSTVALVMATVLLVTEQGHTRFPSLGLTGTPLKLLMLAALLRLAPYPLPGSIRRRRSVCLVSLCTGGYLWLRIVGSTPGQLAGHHWMMVLCSAALFIGGLAAAMSRSWAPAWPFLLLGEVASLVLAPLLDPATGSVVAWAIVVNLALSLALIHTDDQVGDRLEMTRWSRLPGAIGLISLVGWPLTLGFTAHWSYLMLCWSAGLPGLALLASLSYLLGSVPMWQRLRCARGQSMEGGPEPVWRAGIALAGRSLVATFLVFFGVELALSARVWPQLPKQLQFASLHTFFRGDARLLGTLALVAGAVPLGGSYALWRLSKHISDKATRALHVATALLELDWLYAALESLFGRLQRLIDLASTTVEGPFCLGWALFWSLVVVLYLVGA